MGLKSRHSGRDSGTEASSPGLDAGRARGRSAIRVRFPFRNFTEGLTYAQFV
jgi:hypothetical protein